MLKDKPFAAPLRILRPSEWRDPTRLPWIWAVGWWLVGALLVSVEPAPPELAQETTWSYALKLQAVLLASRLLLPLLLKAVRPSLRVGELMRVSLAACTVVVWSSPLAWLFPTTSGAIALGLGREATWALVLLGAFARELDRPRILVGVASLGWLLPGLLLADQGSNWGLAPFWGWIVAGCGLGLGIALFLAPPGRLRGALPGLVAAPLLAALSLGLQSAPDLFQSRGLRVDQIASGRVAAGVPDFAPGRTEAAVWDFSGPPSLLVPDRVRLGRRQILLDSSAGHMVVLVRPGPTGAPEDTTGTGPSPSLVGARDLAARVADIPEGSDSARLLELHRRIHGAIAYTRNYLPGRSDEILARGTGDCKSFAQLFAEGARLIGFRARVVRGLLASEDGWYAHAWTTVETRSGWSDWDATSSAPFPDGRYLRLSPPLKADGAFDGELMIFSLKDLRTRGLDSVTLSRFPTAR